jgi:serine protease Do
MQGALIVEVVPGSPAAEAGLQVDDLIVAIDSVSLDLNHDLADVLAQYAPGDRITVRFWRAGQTEAARIKLVEHPDLARRAYLGVRYETVARSFESPGD